LQTPHSDSHALVLNTRSFKIWCYDCGSEVSANSRKNLLECVELVKRLAQKPPANVVNTETEPLTINDIEYKIKSAVQQLGQLTQQTTANGGNAAIPLPPPPPPAPPASTAGAVPGMAKRVMDRRATVNLTRTVSQTPTTPSSNELERLPRVRGLTNLGNTCFFNAVMQCLAQTPFLLDVLKELGEPGEQ